MTQSIRLSQFVITYGPGAILEGKYGPKVIPSPNIGLFNDTSFNPDDFEISDQRMSQGVLGGARIFRLPSNAELGVAESRYVYRTRSFPTWSLCLNQDAHGGTYGILYHSAQCPECGRRGVRRQEAIRFIRACPAGHMDDVDWSNVVHGPTACSQSDGFRWYGGGGSLRQVEIQCPRCTNRANLGLAYGREWRCGGRFPEREPLNAGPDRPGCNRPSRIIQRQASNLRIPELRTLFTVERYTRLHRLLEHQPVYDGLNALASTGVPITEDMLRRMLEGSVQRGRIPLSTMEEILRSPWPETEQAIREVLVPVTTDFQDLLLEEYRALLNASENGVPPIRGRAPTSPVVFEVNPHFIRRFPGPNGRELRITPVLRLQSVTVQVGYRREIPTRTPAGPADIVEVSFRDGANQEWFPGAQFLGEGIFITMDENEGWHFPLVGGPNERWVASHGGGGGYPDYLFRPGAHDELHPVFVWWHTLSHFLMRAISIDAGYSSAAIRERVYVEIDANRGAARGGIILYATQPGSEGTLGGMIALAPHFDRVLGQAFEMAENCSNDPLCLENHFRVGGYNGPACYSCLLVSETSCEHRNLWLDREVLLHNLP